MARIIFLLIVTAFCGRLYAQQIEWNSSRILLEIEKLNTTGAVLYIAAHPDDENTRLITYLANEKKVRAGYLSLTRGDGGQNLIGEEQGAYLGVIRTQELLAARKVDGGEQFFTRAVDFGYSKSAEETFSKWPHDSLLVDVVWVIRNFRPDIIITRFPPDERAGHGQHTVSAMIAEEAFDAAADPTKFPEQLKYVSVWQAKRIFWNNSLRWDETLPEKIKNGDKNIVSFDDGGFNALLGKSYGEISAESRTNHKSQGFGSTPLRGEQIEYLYLKKGDSINDLHDVLGDINTTWERYRQGGEIKIELDRMIQNYDMLHPERSVDELLKVYGLLEQLPSDQFIEFKKQQLQNILVACLGLWLEPVAEKDMVAQGDSLKIFSTALKRSEYPITLQSIDYFDNKYKVGEILPSGINQVDTFQIVAPVVVTSPYWLNGHYDGMFNIPEQLMRGKAENDPAIQFVYHLKIGNSEFNIKRSVVYKETDAVKGEIYKPLAIVPYITGEFASSLHLVTGTTSPIVKISAETTVKNFRPELSLANESGQVVSNNQLLNSSSGQAQDFVFTVQPGKSVSERLYIQSTRYDTIRVLDAETYVEHITIVPSHRTLNEIKQINYDHIPLQTITTPAHTDIVMIHSAIPAIKVAYIEGAGDLVDESLHTFGLNITTIKPEQVTAEELKKYDAVVIGVRAYNVSKPLADNQQILMDYVKEGGVLITQYSTNWDTYADQVGPYKFKIGRGRVTDENSPVDFLLPDHPVLNYPNKITKEDFNGWIQERGIYFATDLAPEYMAPLAFTDPNETAQNGSLIIADYGAGAFMYTGIAFFRELPAGVPGAYRLFVNLLSYKKAN